MTGIVTLTSTSWSEWQGVIPRRKGNSQGDRTGLTENIFTSPKVTSHASHGEITLLDSSSFKLPFPSIPIFPDCSPESLCLKQFNF
jgi:hypothetical protein